MKRILLSLAFAALTATGALAQSAPRCFPHEFVVASLTNKYAESKRSQVDAPAPDDMDFMVHWEVWASDTGSWTFFGVANGVACVFAVGTQYDGTTAEQMYRDLLGELF